MVPLGHNVNGFEEDLTRYLGEPGKYVVALSAGTAALHLGLVMLGVGREANSYFEVLGEKPPTKN